MAHQQVGAPYRWGGSSPAGFDCSGLVAFIYAAVGIPVPHDSLALIAQGDRVQRTQLQAGDLLVFADTYRPGPSHVAIVLGDGRFIHAVDERRGVIISSLRETYWSAHFLQGVRLLG